MFRFTHLSTGRTAIFTLDRMPESMRRVCRLMRPGSRRTVNGVRIERMS